MKKFLLALGIWLGCLYLQGGPQWVWEFLWGCVYRSAQFLMLLGHWFLFQNGWMLPVGYILLAALLALAPSSEK